MSLSPSAVKLILCVQIQKMLPVEALLLWNVIGSCVSRDRLRHATEYAFEWWSDVSALMERDHFQRLKPCVLLFSSYKDFVCLQKTWNATRLVCNAFILLVYGQFFAINTCDCTYICLLRVLYCSEKGKFRGGVRCSSESTNLYKIISIFYKCLQTIKLRQTTENNGGMSKNGYLKGYLQRQKATPSGPDQAAICDRVFWQSETMLIDDRNKKLPKMPIPTLNPFKLCPCLTTDCKITFRSASIQSTTDGQNQVPALHFSLVENLFHSDVHQNMKKISVPLQHWKKRKIWIFVTGPWEVV